MWLLIPVSFLLAIPVLGYLFVTAPLEAMEERGWFNRYHEWRYRRYARRHDPEYYRRTYKK